ncbi:hypothetical protein O6H91_02G021400 [Diphasiastrum complanatum]|nr:hypothetical protein O6H91_02G021400 [Diphasiastrum complanatum]
MLTPGYGAYAASKAAVETFTKVLTKELKGRRITANVVAPGAVATDMLFAGIDANVVVPGAVATDMLFAGIEATVQRIKALNPFERLGEPRDIAALVLFVVSDEGEWMNGQVIRADGGSEV